VAPREMLGKQTVYNARVRSPSYIQNLRYTPMIARARGGPLRILSQLIYDRPLPTEYMDSEQKEKNAQSSAHAEASP